MEIEHRVVCSCKNIGGNNAVEKKMVRFDIAGVAASCDCKVFIEAFRNTVCRRCLCVTQIYFESIHEQK